MSASQNNPDFYLSQRIRQTEGDNLCIIESTVGMMYRDNYVVLAEFSDRDIPRNLIFEVLKNQEEKAKCVEREMNKMYDDDKTTEEVESKDKCYQKLSDTIQN